MPVLPLQVGGDRIDVCRKPARIGPARKLPADDLQSLGLERRAKTLVQVSTPTRQIIYSLAQSNPLNTLSLDDAGPIELGSSTRSRKTAGCVTNDNVGVTSASRSGLTCNRGREAPQGDEGHFGVGIHARQRRAFAKAQPPADVQLVALIAVMPAQIMLAGP